MEGLGWVGPGIFGGFGRVWVGKAQAFSLLTAPHGCVERGFWGVEKRGFGGVWVRVWGVGGGLVRDSWKSIADFARTARWIKPNCQGLQ